MANRRLHLAMRDRAWRPGEGGPGRKRGSAMVEFTLVFMLFLVVLLTLMEFARGMWTYVTVAQVARQAGAYLMVHGTMDRPTVAELTAVVTNAATGLDVSWRSKSPTRPIPMASTTRVDVDVLLNPDDDDPGTDPALALRGDIVEVKITYPFRLITGGLVIAGNTIPMASTTRVVVAN